MRDVRTVLTETHVIVHMAHGVAEFPRQAIKTINGQVPGPAKEVPTADTPHQLLLSHPHPNRRQHPSKTKSCRAWCRK